MNKVIARIKVEPVLIAGGLSAAADAINEGLSFRQAAIAAVVVIVRHFVSPAV